MNLANYLRELLLFSEKVILPGFGSLKILKKPASLKGNKVIPPQSELVFDSVETMDDGVLSTQLSVAEDLGIEDARQKVLEFIDEIKFTLDKGEGYSIPGLCTVLRDADNKISLEKDPEFIIDIENFGLDSFELDDFEEEESEILKEEVEAPKSIDNEDDKKAQKPQVQKPSVKTVEKKEDSNSVSAEKIIPTSIRPVKKNNRSTVWFVVGAVVVLMAAIVIIPFQTNLMDNNLNFDSFFGEEEIVIDDNFKEAEDADFNFDELVNEFEKDIDSVTSIKNALNPVLEKEEKVASPSNSEFHIIAGSFKDAENANDLQKELVLKGYPALTLDLGNGIYRVSAISFSNKNQALNALISFRESMNMDGAWLMSLE